MSLPATKATTLWLGFLRARVGRKWNTEKRTVCETKLFKEWTFLSGVAISGNKQGRPL